KLKLVVRGGAGYDNIDCAAAKGKDVVVMNTPGQNSNAVAELVFGMMVYMARNQFNGKPGTELKGKTLGLLGFGYVGKAVTRIAKGFEMNIVCLDPFVDAACMEAEGVCQRCEPSELYGEADYISLHIPATKENLKCVGYETFMQMKKGACIVNTARKEIIDEEGLIRAFSERDDLRYASDIAPACADVFQEKFPGRFYFTPKKMGAQTAEANLNAGVAAANQIIAFFEKGDTTFQVNK
ncbi:MAG: NAD(P)-dependent oxidoreductase, partial [Planctomycetota bacterium]